jgi:hypothetical protein
MLEVLGLEQTVIEGSDNLQSIASSLQSIDSSMNLVVVLLAITVIIKGLKRIHEWVNN